MISDDETKGHTSYCFKVFLKNLSSIRLFLSKIETPPFGLPDVSKRRDAKHWLAAITLELKILRNITNYVLKVLTDQQVVSTRPNFTKKLSNKTKSERYNARLVFRKIGLKANFYKTFAPIPHQNTLYL